MTRMQEIELCVYIEAVPERVFDALADYEHFFRGGDMRYCRLTPAPSGPPGGVGAVREIQNGHVRFIEEITAFSRPQQIGYLVTKCSVPLRHEGGMTTLLPRAGGTEIRWVSRFTVPLPIIGAPVARLFGMALVAELNRLLIQTKRELES